MPPKPVPLTLNPGPNEWVVRSQLGIRLQFSAKWVLHASPTLVGLGSKPRPPPWLTILLLSSRYQKHRDGFLVRGTSPYKEPEKNLPLPLYLQLIPFLWSILLPLLLESCDKGVQFFCMPGNRIGSPILILKLHLKQTLLNRLT